MKYLKKFEGLFNFSKKDTQPKKQRSVFTEENLIEILRDGETTSDGITFILNAESHDLIGGNKVSVDNQNIIRITNGGITISRGEGLEVEYILQDIGYDRIGMILNKYKGIGPII